MGYRYFASNKDKEVELELVEELPGFEMGINEEDARRYLKQLGILPITDRQITVIDEAGVRQEKIGRIDKIIFGLKDINKLESDLATGVMRADRLGKTMAGEAGLKLVVYSRPVKTGKGVLESVVYINASWFGEEERKQYINESLSQAILVNMLLGVRGEWSADPENFIRQKLGRYGGFLAEKKTQGFRLVKPAMAQYCSGATLCEQEVWRCYCEGQFVGKLCTSDIQCGDVGTCTDCKWTCSEGAAQVGVPCQYVGGGRCGGDCLNVIGPGWCDIGACGWAYYGPTSTPPVITQIPQTTDTPWPARGSWSVFYFYDKNANGQFDSGDERLPEAVRSQTGLWVHINGYRDYTYGGGLPTIYAQDSVDRKVGCLMGCTGSNNSFGNGNGACDTQPCFFNTCEGECKPSGSGCEVDPEFFGWGNCVVKDTVFASNLFWGYWESSKFANRYYNEQIGPNNLVTQASASFAITNLPEGYEVSVMRFSDPIPQSLPGFTNINNYKSLNTVYNQNSITGYVKNERGETVKSVLLVVGIKPCTPNCTNAPLVCQGTSFPDGCGGQCTGTYNPGCGCADSVCQGSSCTNSCGVVCPGTIPANCNYSAWSPATCSPACGHGQTRSCTPICRATAI